MPPGVCVTELPSRRTLDPIIEENPRLLLLAPYCTYYTGTNSYYTERLLVDLVRYTGRQGFDVSGDTVNAILWTPLLTLYGVFVIY